MQVLQRASLAKQNVDPIDLTGHDQFMQHSKGFLAVVEAARPNINEIDIKRLCCVYLEKSASHLLTFEQKG